MKNAIKTLVLCGIVFGLWCLAGIALGFLLSFSSKFLDLSNFWGALIFVVVISPIVDTIIYYVMFFLASFLLSSRNSAIIALLFTIGYCIYAIASYGAVGGFFLGLIAFIFSFSFVFPIVVLYFSLKETAEQEKQKELQAIYEKAKQDAREELENRQ